VREQPTLETKRLALRPLMAKDDLSVRELANDPRIARLSIWPMRGYGRKMCRRWSAGTHQGWVEGAVAEFAMELKSGGDVVGLIGLDAREAGPASAELAFLLKVGFWGQGYATEAGAAVVEFGFKRLKLNRIYARHIASNTASGRVLAKLGMKQEGVLREFAPKGKGFEDAVLLSLLRREWEEGNEERRKRSGKHPTSNTQHPTSNG
jgi:[ribosomal protein S5]-alanine N-acetyltransferase